MLKKGIIKTAGDTQRMTNVTFSGVLPPDKSPIINTPISSARINKTKKATTDITVIIFKAIEYARFLASSYPKVLYSLIIYSIGKTRGRYS